MPETEEYGVSSFTYRARAPFHPQRIHDVLNGPLPGVIRAKGHFWIATRPGWLAEFSLAGALSSVRPMGRWWASVPESRWPPHPQARAYIAHHWQAPWGDRRQELVFIGAGLDEAAITRALDAALMPADSFTPEAWAGPARSLPRLARSHARARMSRPPRRGNTGQTALPRARRRGGMAAYDRLPPELRAWLSTAALPWSPHTVHRAWTRALTRSGGDTRAALQQLSTIEARLLTADSEDVPRPGKPPPAALTISPRCTCEMHGLCIGCASSVHPL